jgi:DNA polymerase III subunit chi
MTPAIRERLSCCAFLWPLSSILRAFRTPIVSPSPRRPAMTQIDFYTLEPDSPGDRFQLVCRLVERARAANKRVLIHCPDPTQAQHLDRLLWTFRQESFLPHGILGQPGLDAALTPILISPDGSPESECQVLINLAVEPPPFFERFERLCEPLDSDPSVRADGRERYKRYRERGYDLKHHPVRLQAEDIGGW